MNHKHLPNILKKNSSNPKINLLTDSAISQPSEGYYSQNSNSSNWSQEISKEETFAYHEKSVFEDLSSAQKITITGSNAETVIADKENISPRDPNFDPPNNGPNLSAQTPRMVTKPKYSYKVLIQMAINSTDNNYMPLKDIYKWVETNYPWYKTSRSAWKNSIRHNLSLHDKIFIKVENEALSTWKLADGLFKNRPIGIKNSQILDEQNSILESSGNSLNHSQNLSQTFSQSSCSLASENANTSENLSQTPQSGLNSQNGGSQNLNQTQISRKMKILGESTPLNLTNKGKKYRRLSDIPISNNSFHINAIHKKVDEQSQKYCLYPVNLTPPKTGSKLDKSKSTGSLVGVLFLGNLLSF